MKGLSKKQREALIGFVLGDAYVQATGRMSARIRFEHSFKQKAYIEWKYGLMQKFMQAPPILIKRYNPIWKRAYRYYRCQTYSSPLFGKIRRSFYNESDKIIPVNIDKLLKSAFTLAVWYMDDGYYYHRDHIAYIYLSRFKGDEVENLVGALKDNFGLQPIVKIKKGKYPCLVFNKDEAKRLVEIVEPHIIPSLKYKIPTTL